jgi:hypothetical protein|tara:strand:+ start:239 stop:538 length:300 start_codon:yes stop_codon:yes gene_type:complete
MAGIVNGRITVSTAGTAVRFTTNPTPIKYLLLEVPSANTGSIYIGDSTVASNNTPAIAKSTTRDFLFRHDVEESPGDLSDFYADAGTNGDVVNYFAITI